IIATRALSTPALLICAEFGAHRSRGGSRGGNRGGSRGNIRGGCVIGSGLRAATIAILCTSRRVLCSVCFASNKTTVSQRAVHLIFLCICRVVCCSQCASRHRVAPTR